MKFTHHGTWSTALALTIPLSWACVNGDSLIGAPCLSNSDCWSDQDCVRTPTQVEGTSNLGECLASGSECRLGEQNGCACAPADNGIGFECNMPLLPTLDEDEDDNNNDCLCCDCAGTETDSGSIQAYNVDDVCLCCGEVDDGNILVGVEAGACKYCPPCDPSSWTLNPDTCECTDPNIECTQSSECTDLEIGNCEPNGYCSYFDETCDSDSRWGQNAPEASNCVPL